jgi:lipoprotein-anchoring transpeptidase ErfK/SrfK
MQKIRSRSLFTAACAVAALTLLDAAPSAAQTAQTGQTAQTTQTQAARAAETAAREQAGAAGAVAAEQFAPANPQIYRAAMAHRGMRILVSTNERRLLLMVGRDTLMDVPVAVGMGTGFEFEGREYHFETPTGRRSVLAKEENPVWTPPEWHYKERALEVGLELVRLQPADKIELGDGSFLMIVDGQVGRLNQFGNFRPFEPGMEIIFDGKVFVPPFGTAQRRVPDALGPYKLDMGNGYLIHGTHMFNEDSVGLPVSHGCVRMNNNDLDRLYYMVERGTPVFIY